jgi:putative SbcD/Mre11-related phosphoesterase
MTASAVGSALWGENGRRLSFGICHLSLGIGHFAIGHQRPMAQCLIAPELILDSRLALFHRSKRWLAIADLHYGYEISQRQRGYLLPFWGMQTIEDRLHELVHEYAPSSLVLVGDIIHSGVAESAAMHFLANLERLGPELLLIRGNHDRGLRQLKLQNSVALGSYLFHHGHLRIDCDPGSIQIVGHFHPTWLFSDGAGSRLRLPVLARVADQIILPAFSPWAAGGRLALETSPELWVCSKNRVFRVPQGPEPDDQ